MNIEILGKDFAVTEGLRKHIEKRLQSFDTFLEEERVDITLSKEGPLFKMTLVTKYDSSTVRMEEVAEDIYVAADLLKDRLWEDLRRRKDLKLDRERKETQSVKKVMEVVSEKLVKEEKEEPEIIKEKVFVLKPMFIEEAALQMEMLGHDFFVYLDAETNETAVLYKRKDKGLGLITTKLM